MNKDLLQALVDCVESLRGYRREICLTGLPSQMCDAEARAVEVIAQAKAREDSSSDVVAEESIHDFKEGQWWVKELDGIRESHDATLDQKRAVAVVHNLLRHVAKLKNTEGSNG